MKLLSRILLTVLPALMLAACHDVEQWDNNAVGNFEALWTVVDEHYCFFREKDIDWDEVHDRYRARVNNKMSSRQLFDVCASMLDELRDGHTNLLSPMATSYYRKWWSDYPQNYDARLVEQYYFNFQYQTIGAADYGILPDNVGYIRYSSFSHGLGEGNLNAILRFLVTCNGIIIDVRDNGGGSISNVETLVRRFMTRPMVAGYICHKTGPGHADFSEPEAFTFDLPPFGCLRWTKPVVVIANRSTYSAANNFVSIMKTLPNVTVVGDVTGGGSGMPFSSEIPNGWGVRFSACPVYDPEGRLTEFGVEPSPGCKVDLDPELARQGIDTMIEKAVAVINGTE